MIIKYSLVRLSIIFLLVLLFPFVQKQWLNLYLFDINTFSIYKILYYLSGLLVPIFVIINSLSQYTDYKFISHKATKSNNFRGKFLLLITSIILVTLSTLLSVYIFINLNVIYNFIISNNNDLFEFNIFIDKQIIIVPIISILLIFKRTKLIIKKITLINYFIISVVNWYIRINNSLSTDLTQFDISTFDNISIINIIILLVIEIFFYLWSYISYDSYLSDWRVPKPYRKEISPIFNFFIFYLLILLYYSILFD